VDAPVIGPSSPAISLPPWTLLGYRADGRPIYNAAGGAEDDTDIEVGDDTSDDDSVDEDDTTDDGPGEDEAPKPKPPAASNPDVERLLAELERTRAALKKSNNEAKIHRLALKEREAKDRDSEGEHERAIREAAEASENKWKPRIINQAARAALVEAGASGGPSRLLKLLDLDALSVDDDGDVIGLDNEIDRLKAEYEELFVKAETPKPKARPTAAPKQAAPEKPKNSWDRHAARLRGN
jgi:hypothetical protein